MVARWGIPGGVVTTRFSSDGFTGTNTTTPFHVFTGTVDVWSFNTDSASYMAAHGYGGYGSLNLPPPQPYASMETGGVPFDLGGALDVSNNLAGPEVFNEVFKQAALYAESNFPGCQK
jgi:hypothetical protein